VGATIPPPKKNQESHCKTYSVLHQGLQNDSKGKYKKYNYLNITDETKTVGGLVWYD
jgi:hypothetical protein